jgi:hypothetical protein
MVADPDPVVVAPREFDGSRGPGVLGEAVDRRRDAFAQRIVEAPIRARRFRMEADLVPMPGGGAYVRTSDQDIVEARSSRARSAARLSSR